MDQIEDDIHRRSGDSVAKKGRPHPPSDSSPGAFPPKSPRASNGVRRSLRERKDEGMTPAAGTDGEFTAEVTLSGTNEPASELPRLLELMMKKAGRKLWSKKLWKRTATASHKQSDGCEWTSHRGSLCCAGQGERIWYERPFCRAMLVGSSLLALLLLVGVIVLVMYLTNSIGLRTGGAPTTAPTPTDAPDPSITPTPTSAPTNASTAEQIACDFLSLASLSECIGTDVFDTNDGHFTTKSTIPSELGLLTRLFFSNSTTTHF
jgi:hypothetical protein